MMERLECCDPDRDDGQGRGSTDLERAEWETPPRRQRNGLLQLLQWCSPQRTGEGLDVRRKGSAVRAGNDVTLDEGPLDARELVVDLQGDPFLDSVTTLAHEGLGNAHISFDETKGLELGT